MGGCFAVECVTDEMARRVGQKPRLRIHAFNRPPTLSCFKMTTRTQALAMIGEQVFEDGSLPAYSTDIAAAWEVVEKLTSTTKQWFRFEQHSTGSEAVFEVSGAGDADFEVKAEAEDAPLAICLAALNAVRQRDH